VSGHFNFKLGERIVSAPAGAFIFIPRNTPHTFQNIGTEPGVLLFGVTPGGFEKMFAERQGVDASIATQAHIPIVQAMLRACPGRDAYIHGPICVANSHRNRGLAKALFREQCKHRQNQEALTFIREDNEISRRAHASMGMREIVEFDHNNVRYIALEFRD